MVNERTQNAVIDSSLAEFEPPWYSRIPMIKFEASEAVIPGDVVNEVNRVALITLKVLGVDVANYQRGYVVSDLVNLNEKNDKGLYTLLRLPGYDRKVLIIILSTFPILDDKGREMVAFENEDGRVFLNLRKIHAAFAVGSNEITLAQQAGIVTIEEVIHFVQHSFWDRPTVDNTEFQSEDKAKEHDDDPVEQEANHWKRIVYDIVYPQLDLKIRTVDF